MICATSNPPSFGLLMRQVRDGLVRQLDASMAEENLGIGFTHFIGLKTLAHMAPCTANELAQAIDQVPSAVTRLLDKLEARGILARLADPADRRAVHIHLTDAGTAMWRDIDQCGQRVRARALRGMDDATRAQLTRLVEQVRDNLLSED